MEKVCILLVIISIAGAASGYFGEATGSHDLFGPAYHTSVQQIRKEKCLNGRCKLPDVIRLVISINLENKRKRRLNKKRCKNKRTMTRRITVNLGNAIKRRHVPKRRRHVPKRRRHVPKRRRHVHRRKVIRLTINAKNILRRFRQLGVRLIGHGIVYHSYYYDILCGYTKFYTYLTTCKRKYGGITGCLPHLYSQHLIGQKHRYKKYGLGYGLGVLFAKGGIIYHNRLFRFSHGRASFVQYITVCLYRTGKAHGCLLEAQTHGYLKRGEAYQPHVVKYGHKAHSHVQKDIFKSFRHLGVRLIGRGVVYHNLYYSITCSYTRFYTLLLSCKNKYGGISSCFERLYTQHLIGRSHTYKKYGYGFGLGLTFVKGGIVYRKRFFRFINGRDFFIRYITKCRYQHPDIHSCLVLSQKDGCIGHSVDYQQYLTTHTTTHTRVEHTIVSHYSPPVRAPPRPKHTEYHVVSFYHVYGQHGGPVDGNKILEHGVVYHKNYRKLLCTVDKFHKIMSSCHRKYHNVKKCLGIFYARNFLGPESPYKNADIGVNFVKEGVLYERRLYRLLVDRQDFIKYITTCIYHHSSVQSCLYKAQSERIVRHGEEYKKPVHDHHGIGDHGGRHYSSSYHTVIHTITITHIFSQFRRLGVSLVGNGILYHGYYYGLKCTPDTLYNKLLACTHDYGGIGSCIAHLSDKGLIGHNHKFVKYGRGYGLGVKFVRTGVVFEHHIYKYLVRREEFVEYMTVCINTYKSAKICLHQLQKQKLLGVAHIYRRRSKIHHHITRRITVHRTIKVNRRIFSYHGHVYRLTCSTKRFYRLWDHCISRYHHDEVCMKNLHRLFNLKSSGSRALHYISVGHLFGKFRRIGVKLVGLGLLYHGHYYKLRCRYFKVLKYLQRCHRMHINIANCLPQLQEEHLIGQGHAFKRYGYGYGLRVKFVEHGVLYKHKFYKFLVRRQRFIHYMTVCIDTHKNPKLCLAQLHRQKLVGVASVYRKHTTTHHHITHHVREDHSLRFFGRFLVYQTNVYRLLCSKRRFNTMFSQCINHYHHEGICMKRLHYLYKQQKTGHDVISIRNKLHSGVHTISVGHIFGKFRRFGVRLVGRGILYNDHYYKLHCQYLKLLKAIRRCRRMYGNFGNCVSNLQQEHLIGEGHLFKRYGYGYGLHIKFVKRGIVYHKKFYKFRVRRRRFIHYMTVCMDMYNKVLPCLNQLQRQRMLMTARIYRSHTVIHHHVTHTVRVWNTFKIIGRKFTYLGHVYRLRCKKRRFYKLWNRCMKRNHRKAICLRKLNRLFRHKSKGRRKGKLRIFGRFRKLGVHLVGLGITYNGYYYRFRCKYIKFFKALRRCRKSYGNIANCLSHLTEDGLLGRGHVFKKYGYGYGLGVKFVKRGLVFHKQFYKIIVRRRRFMKRMTICVGDGHGINYCIRRFQKRKLLGAAHMYNHHITVRRDLSLNNFVQHISSMVTKEFTYNGNVFKLRCGRAHFYKLWHRCMKKNNNIFVCFMRLHNLFKIEKKGNQDGQTNIIHRTIRHRRRRIVTHHVTHHVTHRTVVHVSRSSRHFGRVFHTNGESARIGDDEDIGAIRRVIHTSTGSSRIGEDEDIGRIQAAGFRPSRRQLFKTKKQVLAKQANYG